MNDIIRYKDCINGRIKLVKDILEYVEELVKKYNIHPEEYHQLRGIVRSRSFMLVNLWHRFLGYTVDAKFFKKVNPRGEHDGNDEDK